MKKFLLNIILLLLTAVIFYGSLICLSGKYSLVGIFVSGTLFGIFLMNLKLGVKNEKINSYKRELEKESISSTENASRVKVLESKIEVLEKALESALKKN